IYKPARSAGRAMRDGRHRGHRRDGGPAQPSRETLGAGAAQRSQAGARVIPGGQRRGMAALTGTPWRPSGRRMRILMLLSGLAMGGAERNVVALLPQLTSQGANVA